VAGIRALTHTDALCLGVIGITNYPSITTLLWKGEEKMKDQFKDKRLITVQELSDYLLDGEVQGQKG